MLFLIFGESDFAKNVLIFSGWLWNLFGWYSSDKEVNLSDFKLALFCCLSLSCWANPPKNCPIVQGKIRSILGFNPNNVHVLSNLVSFESWDQVLGPETWKCRHIFDETFCKTFVGKRSANEIQCKHYHWPLVRHLQIMMRLGAIENAVETSPP